MEFLMNLLDFFRLLRAAPFEFEEIKLEGEEGGTIISYGFGVFLISLRATQLKGRWKGECPKP
jgi:hypothetical protein